MINPASESDEDAPNKRAGANVAGGAYRESITSVDGFTRRSNGRVKFNKDTKKRRRENEEMEDVEMGDAELASGRNKKHKRKPDQKLGHEFKAKVSYSKHCCEMIAEHVPSQKAGGDVKKGGVDPYAYMSLSQAARKGGRGNKMGITGRR